MGFKNWSDTHGVKQIDTPFQAYYTEYTEDFADWLFGFDSRRGNYYGVYGLYQPPGSFIDELLAVGKKHSSFGSRRAKKGLVQAMQAKIKDFRTKEGHLYRALQCGDFDGFKELWYQVNNANPNDVWLSKHLEFCRGQYQRIFFNANDTALEKMLGLYAIEFEKMGIESNDSDFKGFIKEYLEEEGLVYQLQQKSKTGKDQTIRLFDKRISEEDAFEEIGDIIYDAYEAYYMKDATQKFEKSIKEMFEKRLDLAARKGRFLVGKNQTPIKHITSGFTNLTFQAKETNNRGRKLTQKEQIDDIVKQVIKYLDHVRKLTLNDQEWADWQKYEHSGGRKYIEDVFRKETRKFLQGHDWTKEKAGTLRMGLLGELATQIQGQYRLGDKKKFDKIIATGLMYNTKGIELGSDLILRVNSKNYGIQVKNPFKTENGYVETYDKDWNLGKEKSIQDFYKNINFGPNERRLFEFLNINLTNMQVHQDAARNSILEFLRYFSLQFARLDEQEINKTKVSEELQQELADIDKTENLFFVVKGELIQSSKILEGLLLQYRMLTNQATEDEYKQKKSHELDLVYQNKVPPNFHSVKEERKRTGIRGKGNIAYNPDWIIPEARYKTNLLSQIKFTVSLQLQIPSLSALGILKKR